MPHIDVTDNAGNISRIEPGSRVDLKVDDGVDRFLVVMIAEDDRRALETTTDIRFWLVRLKDGTIDAHMNDLDDIWRYCEIVGVHPPCDNIYP